MTQQRENNTTHQGTQTAPIFEVFITGLHAASSDKATQTSAEARNASTNNSKIVVNLRRKNETLTGSLATVTEERDQLLAGKTQKHGHISVSTINEVKLYRVDNPISGCSSGFRIMPTSQKDSNIEVDFQHPHPERCQCLGRDVDAPQVRALLDTALTLAGEHEHNRLSMVSAMLLFLKRVLRLQALGDTDLDLWDRTHWPEETGSH